MRTVSRPLFVLSTVTIATLLFAGCTREIEDVNSAPSVSTVEIGKDGSPIVMAPNDLLFVTYRYSDADGDLEKGTTFQWFRDGASIAGAVESSYILSAEDVEASITVAVTPVAVTGENAGTAEMSAEYDLEGALETWAMAQTEQYGPVLYLHPSEQYMPSTVEWYVRETLLGASDGNLDCATAACMYYPIAEPGASDQALMGGLVSLARDNGRYTMPHTGTIPGGYYNTDLAFFPIAVPVDGTADLTFVISEFELICDIEPVADCLADPALARSKHKLIWRETHKNVSIDANGGFTVVLGETKSLGEVAGKLQSAQLSLNIQVDGKGLPVPHDPAQFSRQPLLAEPFTGPIDVPLHAAIWLDTPDTTRPGDLAGAKSYVHVLQPEGLQNVTDIQHWFFYPFNGPGRARVQLGEIHDETSSLSPLGEHYGDWEVVILRFDSNTNELLGAFMSSHGHYTWYPVDRLAFENGRVLAFPSYNGHAIYNASSDHGFDERALHLYIGWRNVCIGGEILGGCVGYRTDVGIGTLDVDLLNTTGVGAPFEAFNNYEIASIQGNPLPGHEWIDLDMRWGQQRSGMATDVTAEKIQQVLQDQLGLVALVSGVGLVAACALPYPVVGQLFCAAYIGSILPNLVRELAFGGPLLEAAAEVINASLGDEKVFNGPKTPGAKKDEYFYLSCPTESKSDVTCPAAPPLR